MLILVPGRTGLRNSVGFTRLIFFSVGSIQQVGGDFIFKSCLSQGMMAASASVLHFFQVQGHQA